MKWINRIRGSLRTKVSALVLAIIAVILIAMGLLNNFGLELFYKNEKVNEIKRAYERIDQVVVEAGNKGERIMGEDWEEDSQETVSASAQKLNDLLIEYSNKYNITIALIDTVTDKSIYSSMREGDLLLSRIKEELFHPEGKQAIEDIYSGENYRIISHYSPQSNLSYIECIGYCSDNLTMVVMSTPIASLKESVSLANTFTIYIGLFSFLLAVIATFFMVGMFTKPIMQLAQVSKRMGKLDFTAKYTGKRHDEIETLGRNMNTMAERLEKAFLELQGANRILKEDIKRKEEIDAMRRDFIANVSHELKTPIALIRGYAEGLNEGLCEDRESRTYYTEVIMDEAEKMNVMVKQLLTLSALETSGAGGLELETFDLVMLVRGVIQSTAILLGEKKVEIRFEEDREIMVRADEFKLEEVLTNYISNAIHHVSERGYIHISIGEKPDAIKVSVFNTGKNIPVEDLSHLWDKFYKVDKAHSRAYGGTGIGLSIVKAIVESHGGECGVINHENGVEFYFIIPREINKEDFSSSHV